MEGAPFPWPCRGPLGRGSHSAQKAHRQCFPGHGPGRGDGGVWRERSGGRQRTGFPPRQGAGYLTLPTGKERTTHYPAFCEDTSSPRTSKASLSLYTQCWLRPAAEDPEAESHTPCEILIRQKSLSGVNTIRRKANRAPKYLPRPPADDTESVLSLRDSMLVTTAAQG